MNRNGESLQHFERVARIDERIDRDSGEFDLVLATENEASDGHIVRVAGISYPETLPLQLDHWRGASDNLGSVRNIRRARRDGVPALVGVGQIRLTGEGERLAIRRDIVDAIASGHIRGTSLTWEAQPNGVTERTALPKGHPFHVEQSEPNLRKRFGLLFEKSTAIEQSIVAIPADRAAVIGRAEQAPAEVATVWHGLLQRMELRSDFRPDPFVESLSRALAAAEEQLRAAGGPSPLSDEAPQVLPVERIFDALAAEVVAGRAKTQRELDAALSQTLARVSGGLIR